MGKGRRWRGNEAFHRSLGKFQFAHAYTGCPAFAADGYHLSEGRRWLQRAWATA